MCFTLEVLSSYLHDPGCVSDILTMDDAAHSDVSVFVTQGLWCLTKRKAQT